MTQNLAAREFASGHQQKNNNNNKPRVEHEPRSADGHMVNKKSINFKASGAQCATQILLLFFC